MEEINSWDIITNVGNVITSKWKELADDYGLKISINGLPALCGFSFDSTNHLKYKTLITQEMLKVGFLAGTTVYASISHTDEIINAYFDQLNSIFNLIAECENGRSIDKLLDGPVCHSGFSRLN